MTSIKSLAIAILGLAATTQAAWYPSAGGSVVAGLQITEEMSGCNLPAPGEGWVQIGFTGDQYNYFFKIREASIPKAILSQLLSAQASKQKVQVEWTASTKDCGGSRYITGIKFAP